MAITSNNIADISLRPMAMLTDSLRRARVVHRYMNWPIEIIADGVVKLFYPVYLGFEIGRRPWTDMAGYTFHIGVGRMLRRYELWFHGEMTCLATKLDRLCDLIGLITSKCGHKQHHNGGRGKEAKSFSITRAGEVNLDR